ncbi:MAG: hypothetical protein WA996_09050 [Candidatus Promineifilaceae bacterium]
MAFQPMTIDENHRCTSCRQSYRFATVIFGVCVDAEEVGRIASFITRIDPHITHSLLVFWANDLMPDLPATPVQQAEDSIMAALDVGLENAPIGNRQILGLVH